MMKKKNSVATNLFDLVSFSTTQNQYENKKSKGKREKKWNEIESHRWLLI